LKTADIIGVAEPAVLAVRNGDEYVVDAGRIERFVQPDCLLIGGQSGRGRHGP